MEQNLNEILTSKQQKFLFAEDKRLNFLSGSVRSGKTYVSLLKFALFVAESPKEARFLFCGVTLTSLKRNCLDILVDLVGQNNMWYSLNKKEGRLFGRMIFLEGASDSTAEQKIRGMTLIGAYCDEVTLFKEDFFSMLLTRLSTKSAKMYATCNPDAPTHYIKKKFIDNEELDCSDWKFVIADNTFLEQDYIDNITREFTGVFYDRYILGKWVKAEGLVYPMYDNTVENKDRDYEEYVVSMDYGTQNPTAMLLWGRVNDTWYAIKEFYHSGRETNDQKTDEQYYEDLEKLCGDLPVKKVIIDPSAASFIVLVKQKGRYKPVKADNNVKDGIQRTATLLNKRHLLFNECCERTIEEFNMYSWDEKKDDEVIKENDHSMDAVRYLVNTMRLYKNKQEYIPLWN